MDHGSLTDSNGRVTCFKHVILIMTTNAGANEIAKTSIGFSNTDNTSDMFKVIKKTFTPEFRNRLNAIVQFTGLQQPTLRKILDKKLSELSEKLKKSHVKLNVTEAAKEWLVTESAKEKMGGRPIDKLLFLHINNNIADEILFGKIQNGGCVDVDIVDNSIVCDIQSNK